MLRFCISTYFDSFDNDDKQIFGYLSYFYAENSLTPICLYFKSMEEVIDYMKKQKRKYESFCNRYYKMDTIVEYENNVMSFEKFCNALP